MKNKDKNRDNRKVLKLWIEENVDCPYPEQDDIDSLTKDTGLSEKQVRVWFTNYRNRRFDRKTNCMSRIKYAIMKKNYSNKFEFKQKFK
mmetsp:Transcript_13259/g.11732  ORF Transcript_13259/g.11732 Transcript_13259/m.11732 type:complete len:89 (+) Transcript_13259:151-417(+)